ncbi:alkene reductase [Halomonas sp. V046]|uniref:alkene reductase n=1 Tax=Halomonas sp. V046 TaxID=3459611 RepID=UPI0040443888
MSSEKDPLFTPQAFGDITLPHRVLMSPLTRSRAAQPGDVPQDINVEYYRQRAGAGLILSEATQISPQGKGYAFTPGIHSAEQIAGWRKVTDAVHDAGGRMHAQLWHVGRISHPELQPGGADPVAPSAIKPEGAKTFISAESGMVEIPTPRALETHEIPGIIAQYRAAAVNAREAGFDGVEVHAANGYLLDQFLKSDSNARTDAYGGCLENRLRLTLEVVQAVVDVWGGGRVGVRISPTGSFNDVHDQHPEETFSALAKGLDDIAIAYLEVVEDSFQGNHENGRPESIISAIRANFSGVYIANGAYSADEARERIAAGKTDLVTFGRPFIANPDLPERLRRGAPLNEPDYDTFYGGDEAGYLDYPFLDEGR